MPQFIEDDEFILLMNQHPIDCAIRGPSVTIDDMKRMRALGVKTLVEYMYWSIAEPAKGQHDWSLFDQIVEDATKGDMKVAFCTPTDYPIWCPDDWYTKFDDQSKPGSFSIWSEEAIQYELQFLAMVRDRYPKDRVCAYDAQLQVGETIYHNRPAWFDIHAIEAWQKRYGANSQPPNGHTGELDSWLMDSYIGLQLRLQEVLVQTPHRELWTAIHPTIAGWFEFQGNKWYQDIFISWRKAFPNSPINWVLYTYWPHGNDLHDKVKAQMDYLGVRPFVGAEYCEGLSPHTQPLLDEGLRGFILGPIHQFTGHPVMEEWMFDRIKESTNLWRRSKGLSEV